MDRLVKQQVKVLLQQRDYGELLRLCQTDRRFWSTLRLYLYETDESLRWPAIEAVAELMKRWWHEGSRERVREYIRNLLWLLNDESGGIGWNAPQTIAETIVSIPQLLEPYGSIMIAYVLEGPTLLKSGLWAIGRLGKRIKEVATLFQDKLLAAFDSNDPETLGLAVWAMGEIDFAPALPFLAMLEDRKELVQVYIDGCFQEKPLGKWAKEATAKIEQ